MPLEIVPEPRTDATPQAWVDDVRYVARQPILNLQGRVHGYELLFRNSPDAVAPGDRELATQTMLDNGVIFGLERFTNGLHAFVICTAEALTEKLVNVLAPAMTVLALPSSLEFTPALEEACLELKKQGFRIAIDDFNKKTKLHTIVKLADYVRVNFTRLNAEEREYLQQMNFASNVLVAKRVDTQEDYREACAKGFTLFQGGLLLPPCPAQEAQDSCQPALPLRDRQASASQSNRRARGEQAGEARCCTYLPIASTGELAALRNSKGDALN